MRTYIARLCVLRRAAFERVDIFELQINGLKGKIVVFVERLQKLDALTIFIDPHVVKLAFVDERTLRKFPGYTSHV